MGVPTCRGWRVVPNLLFVLLTTSLLAGQPAVAASDAAAQYYEDAIVRFEQQEYEAAVIQLKNALQRDPDFLPAHMLLGEAYLEQGKNVEAEEELLLARRLGADAALTAVPLARVYSAQGKHLELLTDVSAVGHPPLVRAEILAYRGRAHLELGQLRDAEAAFHEAMRLDPAAVAPLVGQARLLLVRGDPVAAGPVATAATALDPDDPEAWNMRASVSHVQGDLVTAIKDYGRAIAVDPDYVEARVARAGVYLDLGRDAEAEKDLAYLRENAPLEPRGAYLFALLHARRGNQEAANEALLTTATIVDALGDDFVNNNPSILLVAGLSNYGLRQFEKARSYLIRYLKRNPTQAGARKLLGSVLLSEGDYAQAIDVLEPATRYAPEDHKALAMLGVAYMKIGRHGRAAELLEKAKDLSGGAPDVRTRLAFSRLGTGDQDRAIEELAGVMAQEPDDISSGLALGVLHLKRGEYPDAERVAWELVSRDPRNPTLLNLLASAQVGTGDLEGARRSLEGALALDTAFGPARINLGKLDMMEGRIGAAEERFQAVLRDNPDEVTAMLELARVAEQRGQSEEAVRWGEKARASGGGAVRPRLYLVDLYLRQGRQTDALRMAQEAEEKAPEDMDVLAALARVHLAMGKPDIARVIYKRMGQISGYHSRRLYRTAKLQLSVNAVEDALWSLEKAVQGDPSYLAARIAMVEALMRAGKLDRAAEGAQAIIDRYPDRPEGLTLAGDVLARRGQHGEAEQRYLEAMARRERPEIALRIFQARAGAGNMDAAIRFMDDWVRRHPDDMLGRQALAETYLYLGKLDEARRRYEEVVERRPDAPFVLNNLAYIYDRTGDPRAMAFAEKAQGLAPDSPAVNDTLGWMLVRRGDPARGLTYLRNAHIRDADNPEIRYHIAVALDALGRRREARQELRYALAAGQDFADIDDARALMERLKR